MIRTDRKIKGKERGAPEKGKTKKHSIYTKEKPRAKNKLEVYLDNHLGSNEFIRKQFRGAA